MLWDENAITKSDADNKFVLYIVSILVLASIVAGTIYYQNHYVFPSQDSNQEQVTK